MNIAYIGLLIVSVWIPPLLSPPHVCKVGQHYCRLDWGAYSLIRVCWRDAFAVRADPYFQPSLTSMVVL